MRKPWLMQKPWTALLCSLLCASTAIFSPQGKAQIAETTQQAVVVLTDDWTSVAGRLQRFERSATGEAEWQPVGQEIPIVVGKKGMGWGRGLFTLPESVSDYRQEGDKRAPAGIFRLSNVFGLATNAQARQWLSLRMPYIHLSESIRCIGDASSQYYNTIRDVRTVSPDWTDESNNENMRRDAIRDEGAYRWGVTVDHNTPANAVPKDKISGSCIFLHLWKGDGSGTSGCTAMAKSDMVDLVNWLDANKHPVLVQLPTAIYAEYQSQWHLPVREYVSSR